MASLPSSEGNDAEEVEGEAGWIVQPQPSWMVRGPEQRGAWHLINSGGHETLCGMAVLYGTRRTLWSNVPTEQRCSQCEALIAAWSFKLRALPGSQWVFVT